MTTNATPSLSPTPTSEPDLLALDNELKNLRAEQHSGAWNYLGDPNDTKAIEAHENQVAERIKRGIEIISILRRTNTGPANPTGTRGRKKAKPELVDEAAIEAALLG